MNSKVISLFQREASKRLNAAEGELISYTRVLRGKIVDRGETDHIRALRERVERARSRHLRWTRYRFLAEAGLY
jgi:hypothetical protein